MNSHLRSNDIIIISQSRWDDVSSTVYSLAMEFSKNNRVFYIDKPFTLIDLIRFKKNPRIRSRIKYYLTGQDRYRKIKGLPDKFTLVMSFLAVPTNWLSKGAIFNFFLRFHQRRMEKRIKRVIKQFNIKHYILFNSFNPFFSLNLPSDIKPTLKIYQCVDSMRAAAYLSKHGTYREDEVAKEADIVLGTSSQIVEDFKLKGIPIKYLPNAANVDHFKNIYFADIDKPKEFGDSGKKVVGYIGSIDFRSNYPLLKKLAVQNQDKLIMLIGPVHRVQNNENIDTLSNVIFTGNIPMQELPRYAKSLDCAIIPFEKNEFTRSIYPLKINEYLACGRPVVSTCFSTEMESFKKISYITDDEQEFIEFVNIAITSNTKEKELKRIQFAEENSWVKRVDQFWRITDQYAANK